MYLSNFLNPLYTISTLDAFLPDLFTTSFYLLIHSYSSEMRSQLKYLTVELVY